MGIGLDEKQTEAIKEIKSRVMKEMIKKRADEHSRPYRAERPSR